MPRSPWSGSRLPAAFPLIGAAPVFVGLRLDNCLGAPKAAVSPAEEAAGWADLARSPPFFVGAAFGWVLGDVAILSSSCRKARRASLSTPSVFRLVRCRRARISSATDPLTSTDTLMARARYRFWRAAPVSFGRRGFKMGCLVTPGHLH